MPGAARAVEPELDEVAVIPRKFRKLRRVVLVIVGEVRITRLMPVPRREVNSKLQSKLVGGIGHVTHHVAAAVSPRAALYAVLGLLGGPQAKAIVMLGNQYYVSGACRFNGPHPLLGVELRGIEHVGVCRPVTPFAVQECVRSKVNNDAEFQVLPLHLLRGWFQIDEVLTWRSYRQPEK